MIVTVTEIVEKVSRPPPLIRPSVSMGAAPPDAVSVMRQCWSEAPDLRPDFHRLHDIFRHLHRGRCAHTYTTDINCQTDYFLTFRILTIS